MSTETDNQITLSDEEMATIERFTTALEDLGVQAKMGEVVLKRSGYKEPAMKNFVFAVTDVGRTSNDEMHLAGVSLEILVEVARESGVFPDDFLPSEETVRKCVTAFWDSLRS